MAKAKTAITVIDSQARPDTPDAIIAVERARLAIDLAARQAELEADATPESLAAIVVADDADYATVTEYRAQVRRSKDELVALRQKAAQPWKRVATTIEEMFRPGIRAAETIEADFRGKLEAYQAARILAEREAREAATIAAETDDSTALVEALTVSTALAQATPGGGRRTVSWAVKRIVPDLLPDEWWTPDTAKIEAVVKAHKGDEPPVIPGVIFEQSVSVAVKR